MSRRVVTLKPVAAKVRARERSLIFTGLVNLKKSI